MSTILFVQMQQAFAATMVIGAASVQAQKSNTGILPVTQDCASNETGTGQTGTSYHIVSGTIPAWPTDKNFDTLPWGLERDKEFGGCKRSLRSTLKNDFVTLGSNLVFRQRAFWRRKSGLRKTAYHFGQPLYVALG